MAYSPDTVVVSAYGQGAVDSYGGDCVAVGVTVLAGGIDFVPDVLLVDERRCTATTKAGAACAAYGSAETGLCVGHQRAAAVA